VDFSVFDHPVDANLMECWKSQAADNWGPGADPTVTDGIPDEPWTVAMPVVDCPGNNVGNCSTTKGAAIANIIWILPKDNKIDDDAPYKMGGWTAPKNEETGEWASGAERWDSFVRHFNLSTLDGDLITTLKDQGFWGKSIYFQPDCAYHPPIGGTGGENYGILAKYPVLVE
jgi:hypothetical protein